MFQNSGVARGEAALSSRMADGWDHEEQPARDWKKLVLIAGLGILSWVATYVGMLELIEANMGELPLVHKVIIAFSVGMLMTMIVWLLDQMFAPIGFVTKVLYALGYVFLTIISVGFGFGFYWKVLESRSEASRSAEGAVSQVQGSLFAASTRLDQLQQTLDSLTAISKSKAENERATGTSCPASKAGDGPRRKMREDDAARFAFASDFVKGRAAQVKSEIGALDVDLAKIAKDDKSIIDPKSGTRNEFMKALGRKLDNTVTGFNAFRTDPQLKQIRADLAERSDKSTFPDTKGGSYQCPDPQLSAALKGVVRAIDGLPEVEKPRIATVEGSEATIEAFRRLTATFFGLMSMKLPPSADEQRELQKKAIQSVESAQGAHRSAAADVQAGLSKRDYVPLAVAVFVDLCLLLVSMGRPVNRLGSLVPKMRAAERGPVIQILSRFSEIHRDERMRESFEVLRHVVFDYHGVYYVAVPLDAPFTETRMEQVIDPGSHKTRLLRKQYVIPAARREDMRVEAHLIANLFASFEKESVFKRVLWLNLESARRQLQRQGSKFANAEAFRIYRFNDGAWSELILGAVMGAARRVEARRGDASFGWERGEPSLDALADRMRQAEAEAVREHEVPRPKPMFERGWTPADDGMQIDPSLEAQYGPYARRARQEQMASPRPIVPEPQPEPRLEPRFEPQMDRHAVAPHEFDAGPDYANNNTRPGMPVAPAATTAEPDNVVQFKHLPRAAPAEEPVDIPMPSIITRGQAAVAARIEPEAGAHSDAGSVTVTATERKYSFSVPMNDPRIEGSLYGVASQIRQAAAAQASAAAIAPEAAGMTDDPPAIAPTAAVLPYAGASDRPTVLALPRPTMEHEHRG